MSEIRFGAAFPTGMEGLMYPVPFCETNDLVSLAQQAEALGFDSIGANDHVITQDYVKEEWDDDPKYYEVFTTLANMAAQTDELVLNTAVTVLPMRDPVWTAKQAATIDLLSEGRLLLGCGVGAYREELEAIKPSVDVPRGKIMDEALETISGLLSGDTVSYDGAHVQIDEVNIHPQPHQDPFPIYVGGNHPNAMKRAVKWGHGWLPAGLTPDEITSRREKLEQLCDREGRDLDEIDIAPQLVAYIDNDSNRAREQFMESQVFKHLQSLSNATLKDQDIEAAVDEELVGTPDEVIERLDAYLDVGVSHFPGIIFAGNDVEEVLGGMERFSEEVMPSFN